MPVHLPHDAFLLLRSELVHSIDAARSVTGRGALNVLDRSFMLLRVFGLNR